MMMFGKKTTSDKTATIAPSSEKCCVSIEPQHKAGSIQQSCAKTAIKKAGKSSIIVHCDVGFGNALFIRGSGGGLNWEKGIMLENVGPREWRWQTNYSFDLIEFKILVNDIHYESGPNHILSEGEAIDLAPHFD